MVAEVANAPAKIQTPWASGASPPYITTGGVPVLSQQSVKSGAASWTDGFPPLCFVPIATGGAGPFGADLNATLNQISAGLQWSQAGGPWVYDATFSASINGYPNNALVASATANGKWWHCLADNNTSNPDTGGANWEVAYLPGPHNLVSIGWAQMPNGLILQWGNGANNVPITLSAGYGQQTVTFPVAFPNTCFQVIVVDDGVFVGSAGNSTVYGTSSLTATNFVLTGASPGNLGYGGQAGGRWLAIGW